MKKIIAPALLALVLCGCDTPNHIEGQLNLKSSIQVTNTAGKAETVAPGTYNATVEMDQSTGIMKIHTKSALVQFYLPTVTTNDLGKVSLSAAQLNQGFGVQGSIYDTSEGIDRVVSESCVYGTHQEYQCTTNGYGQQCCSWVTVDDWGSQDVHEVGYQDTKNVALNIVKGGSDLGDVSGSYTYPETITSSDPVSDCEP